MHESHRFLGLDLAPHKSQSILFLKCPDNFEPFFVERIRIPTDCVRLLGVILDQKLNDASHLKPLLVREFRVLSIVTSL